MNWRRRFEILGLTTAVAILLPGSAWAQEPSMGRSLDRLFSDLLLVVVAAGIVAGFTTGSSLRKLRHHEGINFPSRVRRFALSTGAILTVICEGLYVGAGAWRGIHPADVLTDRKSMAIPLLFAFLWYVFSYLTIRVPRWSGRYALWPLRLSGDHS